MPMKNAQGVQESILITPAPLAGVGKEVEAPPVFDLDIGRVAILICFDINFPELWLHLSARSVDLVFWPSMYLGSTLLPSLARVFHFHIISAVRIHQDNAPPQFIDFVGNPIAADVISTSHARIFIVNVDLSKQIRHGDLEPYEFRGSIRSTPEYLDPKEGWYVWKEDDIVPRLATFLCKMLLESEPDSVRRRTVCGQDDSIKGYIGRARQVNNEDRIMRYNAKHEGGAMLRQFQEERKWQMEDGKKVNDSSSNYCAGVACDIHAHTPETLFPLFLSLSEKREKREQGTGEARHKKNVHRNQPDFEKQEEEKQEKEAEEQEQEEEGRGGETLKTLITLPSLFPSFMIESTHYEWPFPPLTPIDWSGQDLDRRHESTDAHVRHEWRGSWEEEFNVTVVLNPWHRPWLLANQLEALHHQSFPISQVLVIVSASPARDTISELVADSCKAWNIRCFLVNSDYNFVYYMPWQAALQITTQYVWFLDDDVRPGRHALALLLHVSNTHAYRYSDVC
jgi:hypothetical protein